MHMERLDVSRRELSGFRWQEQAVTMSVMSYMNGRTGAFTDPLARLAANLAIDRSALVKNVMGGLGMPAATIVSPWHMGFAEARISAMPFDPAEQRRCWTQRAARARSRCAHRFTCPNARRTSPPSSPTASRTSGSK